MEPLAQAVVGPVGPCGLRPRWSLDGRWTVRLDAEDSGLAEGWADRPLGGGERFRVPGALQGRADWAARWPGARGLRNTFAGTAWLERSWHAPEVPSGTRWHLFLGAFPAWQAWLNGRPVGAGAGVGESCLDVTEALLPGQPNRLTVVVREASLGLVGGFRFAGLHWSGPHRPVILEARPPAGLGDWHLRPVVDASLRPALTGEVAAPDGAQARLEVAPHPGGAVRWATEVTVSGGLARWHLDLPGADLWSPEHPALLEATVTLREASGRVVDRLRRRFGLRRIETEGPRLRLNGRPLFLRGAGQEYFSPALAPLLDDARIRARTRALRRLGFNFYRHHTHQPSPEELAVADEEGLLLCSEVALVSNFARVEPFEAGLAHLLGHVAATAHHPSLVAYGLGNEGVQELLRDTAELTRARAGLAELRRATSQHLVLAAFGSQHEFPDLPQDLETPHLWSHLFNWAYEGLAEVPEPARRTVPARPEVLHEYGKLGVWVDPAETDAYPADGYDLAPYAGAARRALNQAGLGGLEARLIRAAREFQGACAKVLLERARRHSHGSGFVFWTGLRQGLRGGGLADDAGGRATPVADDLAGGANAPVALLMDRDFAGRVLLEGRPAAIRLLVSDFASDAPWTGFLRWQWFAGGRAFGGGELPVDVLPGRCVAAGEVPGPPSGPARRLELTAELSLPGGAATTNRWAFWRLPAAGLDCRAPVVTDLDDEAHRAWRDRFRQATRFRDLETLVRGARAWHGEDPAATVALVRPAVLVADRWAAPARAAAAAGWPVLLVPGREPADWPAPPLHRGGEDLNTLFTPFRSGWDEGPMVTLVEDSPWLADLPHGDWADLQFYLLVNGARPWRTHALRAALAPAELEVVVRPVPKLRPNAAAGVVRDENVRHALESNRDPAELIATEDRTLLAAARLAGGAPVVACALRLAADGVGHYLAARLLDRLWAARPESGPPAP